MSPLADLGLAGKGVGLALFVKGHHHSGGMGAPAFTWRLNSASPSFSEMELTMPLPWMQRRPASMTLHLDESIITGTRAISGSPAIRFRKRTMAAWLSSMASSMLTSMTWAPFFDLLARDGQGFFKLPGQDQARKGLGASDVGALTDVDEQRALANGDGLQAGELEGAGLQTRRTQSVVGERG